MKRDIPDTCEYGKCMDTPKVKIKFKNPTEYVCYCVEHGNKIHRENDTAVMMHSL